MRIAIAAISLLLLIAFALTVASWVRSYEVMDEWSMANEDGQVVAVVSYQGAIHHTRAGSSAAQRRWSYDSHDVPEGATWANFYTTPGNVAWRRFGFVRIRRGRPLVAGQVVPFGTPFGPTTMPAVVAWTGQVGFGSRRSVAPWLMLAPFEAWIVPYWAVAAMSGIVPAHWVSYAVRRQYRRLHGKCVGCGYDLRASTDRCPECGRAIRLQRANRQDAVRS
jgi:hypothetical protein